MYDIRSVSFNFYVFPQWRLISASFSNIIWVEFIINILYTYTGSYLIAINFKVNQVICVLIYIYRNQNHFVFLNITVLLCHQLQKLCSSNIKSVNLGCWSLCVLVLKISFFWTCLLCLWGLSSFINYMSVWRCQVNGSMCGSNIV